jgi:hypothetical protein
MGPRSRIAAGCAAALLVAGAITTWALPGAAPAKRPLGLFTSLPIYWAENDGIADALARDAPPHWARTALEADSVLVPLDTLDPGGLDKLDRLLVAQPRPLAPAENVALDEWVRRGGHLLLFADPMLTAETRYAIGDRRRPQDVVLLSPILKRWGLELRFDEEQPPAERNVAFGGAALPVQLAGELVAVSPGAPATCNLGSQRIVADCRIGKGRALIVADAALLDGQRGDAGHPALEALTTCAFRPIN